LSGPSTAKFNLNTPRDTFFIYNKNILATLTWHYGSFRDHNRIPGVERQPHCQQHTRSQ
jgi:hypothetical protein